MNPNFPQCDFDAVANICSRLDARHALEFGPGTSTAALLAAGVERVSSCEYDTNWLRVARQAFSGERRVLLFHFENEAAISIPELDGERFDIALVDSPYGGRRRVRFPGQEECSRLNTVLYSIERAPVVLLHDAYRPGERATLEFVRDKLGCKVEIMETKLGLAVISS